MKTQTSLAALLSLAALALPASAKTYYVKTTGSDVDPKVQKTAGLSEGAAFQTIQFAIDKAPAGSTILVYPGEYGAIASNNKKLTIKAVEGPDETFITGVAGYEEFDGYWDTVETTEDDPDKEWYDDDDGVWYKKVWVDEPYSEPVYAPVAAELGAWGTQVQYTTIYQTVFTDGTKVKWWWDDEAEYPEDGWNYDAHWYDYHYRFLSITPKKPQGWVGYDPPQGVTGENDWSDWFGETKTGRKEPVFKGGKNTTLVGFSLRNGQLAVWGGTVQNCSISSFRVYGSGGIYSSSGDRMYEGNILFRSSLTDCDIYNNYQGRYDTFGVLLDDVTANRVTIRDNECNANLLAMGSSLFNSLVRGNHVYGWSGVIGWGSTVYNSTIVENELYPHELSEWNFIPTDENDEDGYFDEDEGFFGKWVRTVTGTEYAHALVWGCKAFNTIVYNNYGDDGLQHNVDTNDFFDTTYTYVDAKGKTVTKRYDASSQFVNSCTDVLVDSSTNKKVKSTGNIDVDPLFIDAANGNYRLAPWSPCVNVGADYQSKTGKLDLDGAARKVGAKVDMGAYELPAATPVPADYDGDGLTDPALCFAATGDWWIWNASDSHEVPTCVKLPAPKGATPIAADFDGSGRAQPGFFAGAEKAPFFVHLENDLYGQPVTNSFASYKDAKGKPVSTKGATPVAARLPGGGMTFGVFAANASKPVFAFATGRTVTFGTKGAKPVVADFTGDGKDELGVYTASASSPAFSALQGDENYNAAKPFEIPSNPFFPTARKSIPLGTKGAIPCCADFDNDGKADFATYSATAAAPAFTRLLSTTKFSETRTLPMGSKGDAPVVGVYETAGGAASPAVWTGAKWTYVDSSYADIDLLGE